MPALEPTRIFSSHLPAATGTSLERFLQVLESVPDAEPAVAPNNEEISHMLAAMLAVRRTSEPLASECQNLLQHARAVGHDPVDAQVEQPLHLAGVVDGPDVDG